MSYRDLGIQIREKIHSHLYCVPLSVPKTAGFVCTRVSLGKFLIGINVSAVRRYSALNRWLVKGWREMDAHEKGSWEMSKYK